MKIYADNAATTKTSILAVAAMMPYFSGIYGDPSSLHTQGQLAADALKEARRQMANCLGCDVQEIIFTSGGSEADNQAIRSAAQEGARVGHRHIITTIIEHPAVLHTLDALEREGFEVTRVSVSSQGLVSPKDVEKAIREDTCLVTVMMANNEIGTIEPIEEIGEICRARGVVFHTDAVQAVGHLPIDLHQLPVDMLSLSSHKFYGPKGVGALYVRHGIRVHSLIEGDAQEKNYRAGTENVAAIVGMATALEEQLANLEENNEKLKQLQDRLIAGFSEIPHSILNGDREKRLAGNVNFCFEGIEGESLLLLLDDRGIYAASGSACTLGLLDPSHVLLAIGRPHDIAQGSLRLTLSAENTLEEVDYIIEAVKSVVERLRGMSPVWRDLQERRREHVI